MIIFHRLGGQAGGLAGGRTDGGGGAAGIGFDGRPPLCACVVCMVTVAGRQMLWPPLLCFKRPRGVPPSPGPEDRIKYMFLSSIVLGVRL